MNENSTATARQKANRKRSKVLTSLKRKNNDLAKEIDMYLAKETYDERTQELGGALVDSLRKCSTYSLYASSGYEISLVTSLTCNHKLCNICNWARQKKIRRKYYSWFKDNQSLFRLANGKIITKNQYQEKYYGENYTAVPYDLMHLSLTVPHSDSTGWRGSIFYFKELIRAFNFMRKKDEWLNFVYGGEFGIESTKNENGYHVHIHSLIFVRRCRQNRNQLHRTILKLWNSLTIDELAQRKEFAEDQIEAILKGNRLLQREDVKELNPTGATFINLETIYSIDQNGNKHRGIEFNSEAMLFAVMETISYHFKPKMFNQSDNIHDIGSILDLLPKIYKQILYKKFGCLHGEKCLNVKDDSLLEDYEETVENVDMETGEIVERRYFITNPMNVYPGRNDRIEIRKNVKNFIYLDSGSGIEAVNKLYQNYAKCK